MTVTVTPAIAGRAGRRRLRCQPRPRPRRVAAVTGICLAAVLVAPAPVASARVTVHAEDTTAGATDVALTFRVPNERPDATVVRVDVELPRFPVLPGVLVGPHPGWHSATRTVAVAPGPAQPSGGGTGGTVSVVAAVTWAADGPGTGIPTGIPVGGYDDFSVLVGRLPDTATTLIFKATQTYGDGRAVSWAAPAAPGRNPPADEAPTLTITPAAAGGAAAAGGPASTGGPPSSSAPAGGPTSASIPAADGWNGSDADVAARLLGAAAVVLALLLGVAAFVSSRRRPRDGARSGGRGRASGDDGAGGDDAGRASGDGAGGRGTGDGGDRGGAPLSGSAQRAAGGGAGRLRAVRALLSPSAPLPDASRRALNLAGFGALLATSAAFLPWATTTLSDRGAALLVVHSAGMAHNFRGPIVILMSAVAIVHVGLIRANPGWRTRSVILGCDGLAIIAVALTGIDDGQSVNSHIAHMRVGTGEILNPVTTTVPAYGWWLTLAAGLLVALGGLRSFTALRRHAAAPAA